MFKFNKNEELLATIEKQKDQLNRYEGRLRDIVQAYKSLQNEKTALEKSMKALTSVAPNSVTERKKRTQEPEKSSPVKVNCNGHEGADSEASASETDGKEDAEDITVPEQTESDHEEDSNVQHLRSQIFTLTQSLSVMSDEKSKIVATYQAEKKKLKHEQEVQMKTLQEEHEIISKKSNILQDELTELKDCLRVQQSDREQEQATHSIMLREIQKMLNDERTKNDILESSIKEWRNAAQTAEVEAQQTVDYKQRVNHLEKELNEVRKRLQSAELEANTPSPLLLQLQEEMESMKKEHKTQLELEYARLTEAQQLERASANAEEKRVADLENRLVQISNKLGMYDGKRQKDQISIQHLKDRIAQLDIENAILAKQLEVAKSQEEKMSSSKSDEDLDVDGLKERIVRFQELLKEAANKSNEPIDLSDIVMSLQCDSEDYRKLYLESQQELLQLKEEFERYKTRAQNVLKNMKSGQSNTVSGGNRELEEARRQVQETRERHFHLHARCDDLEAKCVQLENDHRKAQEQQLHIHRTEIENIKEKHSHIMSERERDLRVQRERTIAMLADKDKEIKQLKAYSSAYHQESVNVPHSYGETLRRFSGNGDLQDITEESVTEIITKGIGNDTNIVHYIEQLARKDVTINSIRRHKKQLELQMRQLQDASITKDEKNAQEIAELKERLSECERSKLRENANMEYLKNVFFRYLTTADNTAKQRMLVALVTILQFSPDESRKVGVKR